MRVRVRVIVRVSGRVFVKVRVRMGKARNRQDVGVIRKQEGGHREGVKGSL